MKGLLKKEFLMIWKNFRTYMVMCVIFLIFGVWSDNSFFILFYPAMLCGLIPVSVINFDEKTGCWRRTVWSSAPPRSWRASIRTPSWASGRRLTACRPWSFAPPSRRGLPPPR